MIRALLLSLATGAFLATAAIAEIIYEGGDGATVETAVVIMGAEGSPDGIDAEYRWIAEKHPGSEVLKQALVQNGDKFYDVITISTGGKEQEVFFDITGFFGKF